MNKDKRITFRVSSEEYEKIKKKSKELGFPNSSRYVRIKVEADNDELIFNSKTHLIKQDIDIINVK